MTPPLFAELGKPSSDIFSGYPLGQVKLDVGIQTCGNANINTGGAINTSDWSLDNAAIDFKFNAPCKTTISESWDLNNMLKLGVSSDVSAFIPGCKVNATGTLNPASGKFSTRLNPQLRCPHASVELVGEIGDEVASSITGSIVGGCHGFLAGVNGGCKDNGEKAEFNLSSVGVGYCSPTFQLHGFLDNLETFRVSGYQRISDRLEVGLKVGYKPGAAPAEGEEKGNSDLSEVGIGGRYLISPQTAVRAKIDTNSQIGLGLETKLREGAILTLASQLDAKNINGGNHKIGMGLELSGNFSF